MTRRAIAFECFGEPEPRVGAARSALAAAAAQQAALAPEETELYQLGFEAGLRQARDAFEAANRETDAARARFAAALNTAQARRAEDAARLAEQAAALVRRIVATLTPALAARGFAAEAAERVRDWAARTAGGRAAARVSPAQADALRRELAQAPEPARSVTVIEDPSMGGNALRVEWEDGLAEIDLDRAVEQITAALDAFAPAAALNQTADAGGADGEQQEDCDDERE